MSEQQTFHQAVCPGCPAIPDARDHDHWRSRPHRDEGDAQIKAGTHDRLKHDGESTATVRTFEAEAIGHLPREEPPIEGEEPAEVEA